MWQMKFLDLGYFLTGKLQFQFCNAMSEIHRLNK